VYKEMKMEEGFVIERTMFGTLITDSEPVHFSF
jgi:hypothetical protein